MSKASIARTQSRLAQINGVAPQVITEAFTRQHYVAIANIFKNNGTVESIAESLADLFEQDNAQFRRAQFLKACGF
jgi:hypothetical protein